MHNGLTRQGLSCTPTHRISTEETRHTQTPGGCHPRGYREGRWGVTGTPSHLSTQPQVNFPITKNTHLNNINPTGSLSGKKYTSILM